MSVTLHDVAARAEVSIATVSRALNNLPVSKAARERVQLAVAELGYVPNESARALRSDRTLTMGLIFSDLRNMLGVDLLDTLSAAIEESGYSLMIATARGDAERYDLLMRRFLERRVDGLFCVFPSGRSTSLAKYKAVGTPVLTMFGRGRSFAGEPLVRPSFAEAAGTVAQHLHDLGHRSVAVLIPGTSRPMATIAEQLTAHGVAVTSMTPDDDLVSQIKAGAHRRGAAGPTALVAPDPYARGVAEACALAGVRVPEDLALVCVTDPFGEPFHLRREHTTVMIDPQRMGRACAAAMLGWLASTRPPDLTEVQGGVFTARRSTTGRIVVS